VLDVLASLVDKSLVQAEKGDEGDVRYRLLEGVREYALEELESRCEAEAAHRAHALHFLDLAEHAGPELVGRYQRLLFLRIEQEHDNLRSALRWLSSMGEYGLDGSAAAQRKLGRDYRESPYGIQT
jgi:predicted ATPase